MKTFEEFAQEKENCRSKIPGELGFNPYQHYLGFLYESGRYTFLEGPRVMAEGMDFIQTANSLCDLLEECPLRYELNFSEKVPEQEQKFLKRLAEIVLGKKECESHARDMANYAADLRPSALRAAGAGLSDKYK